MNQKEKVVYDFWRQVWNEKKTELIEQFMTENFVIHSAGKDITPRAEFIEWVKSFQSKIQDLKFEVTDIFSSGDKVSSRWTITGKNLGFMGTEDNKKAISLTGITISKVNDEHKIYEKWVERSAFELYQQISD